jgi:hypothetical protein
MSINWMDYLNAYEIQNESYKIVPCIKVFKLFAAEFDEKPPVERGE